VHDAVYDEQGKFHSTLHPVISNSNDSQRYIASIKVINQQLLDLVNFIRTKDKGAVIIIQADHGPTFIGNQTPKDSLYWITHADDLRLKTKEDFRYTFGIFSAIYLPHLSDRMGDIKEYFSKKLSLINTFRQLFAYLSDQQPQLLQDKSHYLYFDKSINAYKEADISTLQN
jgi:hypothetical protein